jgi:hypothetical protein
VEIPATSSNIPGTLVLRDNTGGFDLKPASIVNADISNSAAIAGTKIAPTFGNQDITVSTANRSITNTGNFALSLGTNNTERMRIDSNGRILIGTTSVIDVEADTQDGFVFSPGSLANLVMSASNTPVLRLRRRSVNGNAALFYRDTTNVGSISVTTTATAYNTSSDYRLKQNVEPMVGGLTKLAQLKPSTFEFKSEPGAKVDGFIAHEVQAVVPQAVTGEKDGDEMQGLDHSKLVPVLVAAVQELSAKVAALESALELK